MGKSVGAVIAGFICAGVLSVIAGEILPPDTLALPFVCLLIFACLGSYVAARLAPNRPLRHAIALGGVRVVLILLFPILHLSGTELATPAYHWADLLLALPVAWLGGAMSRHFHGEKEVRHPAVIQQ